MTGLWKGWKAKGRLPPLSTSPLGNHAQRRRDSHIPTAPTTAADGKVENQKQVFYFPTATVSLIHKKEETPGRGRASPGGRRSAPPKSQKVIVVDREK